MESDQSGANVLVRDTNESSERRDQFLLEMYGQMWANINRHILVVWQSVGVVLAAFAIFALVEKQVIPIDIASTLMVVLSIWLLAHLFDSNYWYNRNLAIITNIERQFLRPDDAKLIHPYFTQHRSSNSLLDHLSVTAVLGGAVWVIILLWHFWQRVRPELNGSWNKFDLLQALPYVFSVAGLIWLLRQRRKQRKKYEKFLKQAPGFETFST